MCPQYGMAYEVQFWNFPEKLFNFRVQSRYFNKIFLIIFNTFWLYNVRLIFQICFPLKLLVILFYYCVWQTLQSLSWRYYSFISNRFWNKWQFTKLDNLRVFGLPLARGEACEFYIIFFLLLAILWTNLIIFANFYKFIYKFWKKLVGQLFWSAPNIVMSVYFFETHAKPFNFKVRSRYFG